LAKKLLNKKSKLATIPKLGRESDPLKESQDEHLIQTIGNPIALKKTNAAPAAESVEPCSEITLLKPVSNYSTEFKELAEIISRDIYMEKPNVKWSDIAGLETSKRLIKEAIVLPIKYPQ
jgi:katanin p60 ATPase-containing subunit A1